MSGQQAQTRKDIESHIIAKAWKNEAFKQELLTNSKAVINKEFGIELPDELNVSVYEENPTSLYFVLPLRPQTEGQEVSQEELESIAGGTLGATLNITLLSIAVTPETKGILKGIRKL
jgi:hypothetical protein